MSYGFDTLCLPYITSGYFEENGASGRVLEKLGFVETGRTHRLCLAVGLDMPLVESSLNAIPSPHSRALLAGLPQAHTPTQTNQQ